MIRVLLADDHRVIRDALRYLLEAQGDIQVVGMAANGEEALELSKLSCPNVVVMDISMPRMDGIEATKRICECCPETRVAVLTFYNTTKHIQEALQAGASGYLLKDSASHELVAAIRALFKGDQYFSSKIAKLNLHHKLGDEQDTSDN